MRSTAVILLNLCLLAGCAAPSVSSSTESEIAASVNKDNQIKADMRAYRWLDDDDPAFLYMTMARSNRFYDEGGTGILYYGYAGCEYCERAVPVLNAAAKDVGIEVFYVNVYEDIRTDEDVSAMLKNLEPAMKREVNPETGEEEPVMYTPEVVALKDGVIVGHHTALVDEYIITDEESQMNDAEKEHLTQIYKNLFSLIR